MNNSHDMIPDGIREQSGGRRSGTRKRGLDPTQHSPHRCAQRYTNRTERGSHTPQSLSSACGGNREWLYRSLHSILKNAKRSALHSSGKVAALVRRTGRIMEASFLRAFLGLEETSCSTLFTIPVSKPSTEIQLGAIPCSSDMSTLDMNKPNQTDLKRSSLCGSNSQLTTDL